MIVAYISRYALMIIKAHDRQLSQPAAAHYQQQPPSTITYSIHQQRSAEQMCASACDVYAWVDAEFTARATCATPCHIDYKYTY